MSGGARTHWTAAALLWISLCGIVSSYPIRTNATLLEKKWETLFSRSYLGITGGKSELNWESDYLQGIKRVRRLYCNVGIGFHLQVLPDGRISGAHNENQYSEFACGAAGPEREKNATLCCVKVRARHRCWRDL